MRGFAALPLIIILVIVGVVGAGWYTFSTKQQAKVTISPSPSPTVLPTPSPTSTPTPSPKAVDPATKTTTAPIIDCVGPDGQHAQSTKQDCDNLWKAWATPTPTPTSTPAQTSSQSSGGCNTSTDLGNLTVNIQPQSGQSLVGDAGVTMSNGSGDCAGHDSRLSWTQIIRQGSTSITFPSFRPGKFHIQVGYHGNNYDNDVNINPGDNSITVTVNN